MPARRDVVSLRRPRRRRNLQKAKISFCPLQALDIPRFRQKNVWKSLEIRTGNLEKLAKILAARRGSSAVSAPPPVLGALARPCLPRRSERLGAIDDLRVFAVRWASDSAWTSPPARGGRAVAHVDRPAGVGDDKDAIAEIAGVARRRLERIVGQHAAEHQRRRAERVERLLERRADEGAVGALADDRLAGERLRLGLEGVAGRSGA